jgi:hypothetical protein
MKKLAFLAAASAFALSSAALADQPLAPNPNAKSQGNCVGVFSSQVKHNGPVVSEQAQAGDRSTLVHEAQQADCPPS